MNNTLKTYTSPSEAIHVGGLVISNPMIGIDAPDTAPPVIHREFTNPMLLDEGEYTLIVYTVNETNIEVYVSHEYENWSYSYCTAAPDHVDELDMYMEGLNNMLKRCTGKYMTAAVEHSVAQYILEEFLRI